jgi:hypothetical protein
MCPTSASGNPDWARPLPPSTGPRSRTSHTDVRRTRLSPGRRPTAERTGSNPLRQPRRTLPNLGALRARGSKHLSPRGGSSAVPSSRRLVARPLGERVARFGTADRCAGRASVAVPAGMVGSWRRSPTTESEAWTRREDRATGAWPTVSKRSAVGSTSRITSPAGPSSGSFRLILWGQGCRVHGSMTLPVGAMPRRMSRVNTRW